MHLIINALIKSYVSDINEIKKVSRKLSSCSITQIGVNGSLDILEIPVSFINQRWKDICLRTLIFILTFFAQTAESNVIPIDTSSILENSSEPDQINNCQETYELEKDGFDWDFWGHFEAKNQSTTGDIFCEGCDKCSWIVNRPIRNRIGCKEDGYLFKVYWFISKNVMNVYESRYNENKKSKIFSLLIYF